tara:strand:+ start:71 stop:610 length:540 start_codon:yes stop_codon:yes gene_type:complete
MKIKNAMIDVETLAVDWNAVVLTLGAVKFDPYTNEVTDKLHIRLDTESQVSKGRTICEDTLAWWGKQSDSVKEDAFSEDRVDVGKALDILTEWSSDTHRVWCQGPSFDFPIMDSLYRQYDRKMPWTFWNQRDARTVTSLVAEDIKSKINFDAHNAAEDCVAQAKCVQYVFDKLKISHTF